MYQLFPRRVKNPRAGSVGSRNDRTSIAESIEAEAAEIVPRRTPLYQVRQYSPHARSDTEAVPTQARAEKQPSR